MNNMHHKLTSLIQKAPRYLSILSLITVLFTLSVMGLGAFTRLSDAGLGCPDWPGCYGQLTVPKSAQVIPQANDSYTQTPLVPYKAWAEMIHRYFAGTLALLMMGITVLCLCMALFYGISYLILGMLLFILVIYQALLGMWTVTWKLLPIVVSQHLLGGMLLLVLLWLIFLKTHDLTHPLTPQPPNTALRIATTCGLILVFLQIALGAWTSTNYAALSCPNFPFCSATGISYYDFRHAFQLTSPIGVNYEGGRLSDVAKMTIQMTHRFGATIVSIYLILLALWIYGRMHIGKRIKRTITIILFLLGIQIGLGMTNVLCLLPLPVALSHTLIGALLLISMVTLNYFSYEN